MSLTALSGRGTLLIRINIVITGTGSNAIAMATSATYTPEDTGVLSVRASYTDGHGANKAAVGPVARTAVIANTWRTSPRVP